MPAAGIDEKKYLRAFLEEAEELLEKLSDSLLELEKDTENTELVHEVFRLIHSIKSESALLGFTCLSELAHRLEDVFERIRSGGIGLDKPLMDKIFTGSDLIHEMIARISRGESDSNIDDRSLIEEQESLGRREELPEPGPARPKRSDETTQSPPAKVVSSDSFCRAENRVKLSELERIQLLEARDRGEGLYRLSYRIDNDVEMKYPRAYLVFNKLEMLVNVVKTVPEMAEPLKKDALYSRVTVFFSTDIDRQEILEACEVDQVSDVEHSPLEYDALLTATVPCEGPAEALTASGPVSAAAAPAELPLGRSTARPKRSDETTAFSVQPKIPDTEMARTSIEKSSIRVETRKLNDLWRLLGELILCKGHLSRLQITYEDLAESGLLKDKLESVTDFLEKISNGMQQAMMETRMVPIAVLFNKFPRLVRDLSRKLGKEVELRIEGKETEIDRSIIEILSDPLTHIIRNALDHGIESSAERLRKGKNVRGIIHISAWQQGGKIIIEIIDDGCGLDVEKIRQKAGVEPNISEDELFSLVFAPGFSTKDDVTEVSGRGVGMDVVATRIKDNLKGEVLVKSRKDLGTTITILLPLTLTIVHSLVIRSADHYYAVPIRNIDETVKITEQDAWDDSSDGKIPLVSLKELLYSKPDGSRGPGKHGPERIHESEEINGVIIRQKGKKVCLLVDELVDEEDVVIKPVDDMLNLKRLFSGVSVLGDGRILFVLDTARIVENSGRESGE